MAVGRHGPGQKTLAMFGRMQGRGPRFAALGLMWGAACGDERGFEVVLLPELRPEERSAVWTIQIPGQRPWAFAADLTEPDLPTVWVDPDATSHFSTFACSLAEMGLPPGTLALRSEPSEALQVPPPIRRLQRSDLGFSPVGEDAADVDLRRLPVGRDELCRAVSSRMEAGVIEMSGPQLPRDVVRVNSAQVSESRAVYLFWTAHIEWLDDGGTVTTATSAQAHLLNLRGPDSDRTLRRMDLERMTVSALASPGDGQLVWIEDDALIWFDLDRDRELGRYEHPILQDARFAVFSLESGPGGMEGHVLLTSEPVRVEGTSPPPTMRALLQLKDGGLHLRRQVTLPYRASITRMLSVPDGTFILGLGATSQDGLFLDPQGQLTPVELPAPPPGGWRVIELPPELYLLDEAAEGFRYDVGSRGASWTPGGLSERLGSFSEFDEVTRLKGRLILTLFSTVESRGFIMESEEVGPCPLVPQGASYWRGGMTFEALGTWLMLPTTRNPTTFYTYTLTDPGPRCLPQ